MLLPYKAGYPSYCGNVRAAPRELKSIAVPLETFKSDERQRLLLSIPSQPLCCLLIVWIERNYWGLKGRAWGLRGWEKYPLLKSLQAPFTIAFLSEFTYYRVNQFPIDCSSTDYFAPVAVEL